MKSGTSFFKFPSVIISRKKYQELIIAENTVKDINIKRNAKGQFEMMAK